MAFVGYAIVQLPDVMFRIYDYFNGNSKAKPGPKFSMKIAKERRIKSSSMVISGTTNMKLITDLKLDIKLFKDKISEFDERLQFFENRLKN